MKILMLLVGLVILGVVGLTLLFQVSNDKENGTWRVLAETELLHGSRISKVMFFDSRQGIAISPGAIGITNDGGSHWVHTNPSEDGNYYSFAFADRMSGIVVGSVDNELPLVLRTLDAGASWRTLKLYSDQQGRVVNKSTVFLDACYDLKGTIWIVGNKGIVNATIEDDRLSINSVHTTNHSLYSISCTDSGQIWAVGGSAVLVKIGKSWISKAPDTNYVNGKIVSVGNELWLLGKRSDEKNTGPGAGVVLKSGDFGDSWQDLTPKRSMGLYDLQQMGGTLWLIGEAGQIYYSYDSGGSWVSSRSPTNANLLSIYFLDDRKGWITGDRGTVLVYGK